MVMMVVMMGCGLQFNMTLGFLTFFFCVFQFQRRMGNAVFFQFFSDKRLNGAGICVGNNVHGCAVAQTVNASDVDMVDIATPHIAGYSYQGKQMGTAMAVQAVARYFGITELYDFFPEADIPDNSPVLLDLKGKNHGQIAAVFQYNYPIFTDDFRFRMEPDKFEKLRSEYQYRREIYVE